MNEQEAGMEKSFSVDKGPDFRRILQQIVEETQASAKADAAYRKNYLERLAASDAGVKEFERRAEMLARLRQLSIQQTHPQDWVLHRAPDGALIGIPSARACNAMAPLWGVKLRNVRPIDAGDQFAPMKIPKTGAEFTLRAWADAECSATEGALFALEASRDSDEEFTGRDDHESDLRGSVYTLLISKAVRIFSGLSRVAGAVLEEAWKGSGKTLEQCTKGHGFGSSADRAATKVAEPEAIAEREKLREEILRRVGGDKDAAKALLKEITANPAKSFVGFSSTDQLTQGWQIKKAVDALKVHPKFGDQAKTGEGQG